MISVTRPLHFRTRAHGRQVATTKPSPLASVPERVPRIARLMALAIVFDRQLRSGEVKSVGELARRHRVSQPRMTQILNLTLLAPTLQERVLMMTARMSLSECDLRRVATKPPWGQQAQEFAAASHLRV